MAGFSELVKNLDRVRMYMRDFYIYGFRSRGDFQEKSARTYDNERRRIESYLGPYIRWHTSSGGRRYFVSLDSGRIYHNPLYSAWKSKSFTTNDILLHFFLLDLLAGEERLSPPEMADRIMVEYHMDFDPQTIRIKANEYADQGLLCREKIKKTVYYVLHKDPFEQRLASENRLHELICFFQGEAPLGAVGSFLLDRESGQNRIFTYKHKYIVHTLDDLVLFHLLLAIREKRMVALTYMGKVREDLSHFVVPLKIMVSTSTGRQYLCGYRPDSERYHSFRLDTIAKVWPLDPCEDYDLYAGAVDGHLEHVWGVSFGNRNELDRVTMVLRIHKEREYFVLDRLKREGRGGVVRKLDENTFEYTRDLYDCNEMMAWVKTFIGRIIRFSCTDRTVTKRFYQDMDRLAKMYLPEESPPVGSGEEVG